MRKRYPELVENLTYNPLPASFEVIPVKAEFTDDIKADLLTAGPGGTKPAGIESVKDGGEKARKVVKVGSIIEAVFLVGLDRAAHRVDPAHRQHDPAIDLRAAAGDRGDEARRRDELVRAGAVHDRGLALRSDRLGRCAILLLLIGKAVVLPALPNWESDNSDISALAFELTALMPSSGPGCSSVRWDRR